MHRVAALCLLGMVAVATADLDESAVVAASCSSQGYMYPDPNNLCFVWLCETVGEAPIKRACPKGVRVPSWWEGGMLNMCNLVNIDEHGGEEICLRCDANDPRPTINCASNPCDDNCACVDTEHTYRCDCPYTPGVIVDLPVGPLPNYCEPNMCENGASCQSQYDGYFCFCPNGWTGFRCEIPICDWHPCLNGGTCVIDEIGYHCECTDCWEGSCCSDEKAICGPRCPPCRTGPNCDQEIDTCECKEGLCIDSKCVNTDLGPRCEDCPACHKGPFCKQTIDSCSCKPDYCPDHSTCFDLVGDDKQAIDCVCNKCYEGPSCEKRVKSCECDNPCEDAEKCTMVNGLPLCGCRDTCLTGPTCSDVPNTCECNNPCENGRCKDTPSGPICEDCDECYTGQYCSEQVISCTCNSPCNPGQTCDMVNGSPKCSCSACYEGPNCEQAVNSCECSNPCNNKDTCIDGPDGPYCECDCVGAEICVAKLTGRRVCECPLCLSRGDRERGCPVKNTHLCECENPCTGDQQVCVDGDGPGDQPICKIGNPSSGNAFTVVFEENETEYRNKDIPLELYFTPAVANSGSRYVNIQSAGLRRDHHCYFNFNFTIPENDVYRYTVERCMMHNLTGLANLAIKATELNKNTMIVYGINKDRWTADGFLAVPDAKAGKVYQTISYSPSHLATQFAVVALRDDTTVTMTLSDDNDIPGQSAGSEFIVKMNAFQTYQVQARCADAKRSKKMQCERDLSGTIIRADQPIHVFSGNVRAFIEAGLAKSRDHLIEQLVSTDRWGKMFGLVTVPQRAVGEIANVMGLDGETTDVTVTSQDGTRQTFTLPYTDARGMRRYNKYVDLASGTRYYIEGSKPLSVMQLVKSRDNYEFHNETIHDPAAITIPPVEQFTNYFFISTPSFSGGETREPRPYVFTVALLVAPASVYQTIRVNNKVVAERDFLMPWGELQGDRENLYGAAVRIPHGTNLIVGAGNFQCIIYGSDDRESYGFPAAMNMAQLVHN